LENRRKETMKQSKGTLKYETSRGSALIAVAAILVCSVVACAQEPTLTSAVLKTITDGDDRDHDTGVFVQVTEPDGHTTIAQIYNAELGGQYGYADHETHELTIPLYQKAPVPKSKCQSFKFRMGIQATGGVFGNMNVTGKIDDWPVVNLHGGNDKWKFDAWLTLHFSDGSTLVSNKLDQTLESNGGRLVWDNLQ
jgi:hypothetical protein